MNSLKETERLMAKMSKEESERFDNENFGIMDRSLWGKKAGAPKKKPATKKKPAAKKPAGKKK